MAQAGSAFRRSGGARAVWEVLDSHDVDDCGEKEDVQSVQVSLTTPYDPDCQVRLCQLETKLLEDLKFFRHKQVIHPSLQEVGLKLGSVDPERSIDLKYLGVQLPLTLSKDFEFGASSTSSQDTGPSFISRTGKTHDFRKIKGWQRKFHKASGQEDTGLSFISRTGKTHDFRKIKGWQGKFHNASGQEEIISKGSLKNQSAFYSDKLDEYLENEGKLMETSLGFSTSASNSSVLCQPPSKNTSCIEKNQVLLPKNSSIAPPSSYTFKLFSLPSVFRKKRRKTKNRKISKKKRATARGKAKFSKKFVVPPSFLSKKRYAFPEEQVGGDVPLMPELGGNVQERQRIVQQTQQLPKEKLMDLVREYCVLKNWKLPTCVTEEQAKPQTTLFVSQDHYPELLEKHCGAMNNSEGLTSQIQVTSKPATSTSDTQATTIFPSEPISVSQAVGLFPKVCPVGAGLAQMAVSESNFAYCSSQQLNSSTSSIPLQSGNLTFLQLPRQQIAHHTLQHVASLQAASSVVTVNRMERLDNIKIEEGELSYPPKVKSEELDTMPEESELMVNTTDRFELLTDMMRRDKSMVATQCAYALELSSEKPCMHPDIPSGCILTDHSYVTKKPNSEIAEVMFEKKQHAQYFEDAFYEVSGGSWQTEVLANNIFMESVPYWKEAAQLKSLVTGQTHSTQIQRLTSHLKEPEQLPLRWITEQPEKQQVLCMDFTEKQQIRSKSFLTQWENQDNFELPVRHKNERGDPLKLQWDRQEERRQAEINWAKDQNYAPGMEYVENAQGCLYQCFSDCGSGPTRWVVNQFQVKNTDQKEEFVALGVDEKPCPQNMETMLKATMSWSDSEKNEPKFHFGAVPCNREAVILEMVKKDAVTMETLSSDAAIFHPDVVLSDHTYVTKLKAEKEQQTKLREDISDSTSLLIPKQCGSMPGSFQNIQQAHISSNELHVFSLDTMKSLLVPSSSSSEQSKIPGSSEKKGVRKQKAKCRKYYESYLDYGFTCVGVNNEERPQCVICLKVLAAESMRPNKLKRHLESLHPNDVGKPREFFIRKLKEYKPQQSTFTNQTKVNANGLLSSYKMAYHIAQCKKPHTIAEELILPAAVDMVTSMLGEEAGKQLLKVPLSNNTISRRIDDMAEDINDQLICSLKGKEFALQLGEATTNHKDTYLICYVRFVNEKKIVEDLLFCKEMKGGTTDEDMFEVLDDFMVQNQIDWEKCVGVCTDEGRSMAGCYQGLQALIQSKAPHALWTHCIIHREALAAENLSEELHDILKTVIKVVNFIKTRPMKASFFAKMCDSMGAERSCLLFYSSSHWLSLSNSLLRLYELRNEIYSYLQEEEHCLADRFIDSDFVIQLAFLSDLFEKLNALNMSLQGSNTNILQLLDRVAGLKKKVILWKSSISKGDYKCFPSLDQFLQTNEMALKEELRAVILQYLSQLHLYLQKYFPEDEVEPMQWVRDPFSSEIPPHFNNKEAEQLIDVSTDSILKMRFQSQSLPEFWCQSEDEYPVISRRALRILIPFATTYLCEAGFSAIAVIKSKYRAKINIEKEMRVAISKITPRFYELCKEKQAQPSH
ncbi:uncharacterized protein [Tiliqua scincoides]|uniref:uncharacterized protein isoform X2 n=1 Tax=Tiliqua scincoides TaxID=71010 RepID=UPI003462E4BE